MDTSVQNREDRGGEAAFSSESAASHVETGKIT